MLLTILVAHEFFKKLLAMKFGNGSSTTVTETKEMSKTETKGVTP